MRDAVAVGRMARWLLLASTVLGLAAMHSLGHGHGVAPHDDGHGMVPPSVTVEIPAGAVLAAPMLAAAGGCGGDGCTHPGGPGRHRDDLPAWSICLAVLAAAGIVVLLTWLPAGRAADAATGVGAGVLRLAGGRAPPWPGVGLRLASVSVMRR